MEETSYILAYTKNYTLLPKGIKNYLFQLNDNEIFIVEIFLSKTNSELFLILPDENANKNDIFQLMLHLNQFGNEVSAIGYFNLFIEINDIKETSSRILVYNSEESNQLEYLNAIFQNTNENYFVNQEEILKFKIDHSKNKKFEEIPFKKSDFNHYHNVNLVLQKEQEKENNFMKIFLIIIGVLSSLMSLIFL